MAITSSIDAKYGRIHFYIESVLGPVPADGGRPVSTPVSL